jgi:hypothetical protein
VVERLLSPATFPQIHGLYWFRLCSISGGIVEGRFQIKFKRETSRKFTLSLGFLAMRSKSKEERRSLVVEKDLFVMKCAGSLIVKRGLIHYSKRTDRAQAMVVWHWIRVC